MQILGLAGIMMEDSVILFKIKIKGMKASKNKNTSVKVLPVT